MDKQKSLQKSRYKLKRQFYLIVTALLIISFKTYSCGGGVVPYVPTQTGATRSAASQYFLFEKGVAIDLFDIKKLQPIFRNIILSGNDRKEHKSRKNVEKKKKDNQETADSTDVSGKDIILPILNIHRLH